MLYIVVLKINKLVVTMSSLMEAMAWKIAGEEGASIEPGNFHLITGFQQPKQTNQTVIHNSPFLAKYCVL